MDSSLLQEMWWLVRFAFFLLLPRIFSSQTISLQVPPVGKLDKIYDAKMTKLLNERDRQLDLNESHNFYSWDNSAQNEVQRFLLEGLDMKKVVVLLSNQHNKLFVNQIQLND